MQLEVHKVHDLRADVLDIYVMSTEEDEQYAQACGYDNVHAALLESARHCQCLIGAYWEGMCVALIGVSDRSVLDEDDKCAQLWAHTSPTIRNRPLAVLPALAKVLELATEAFPEHDLYAFYRDDDSVGKLAAYAGFTKNAIEHDVHGIKHILAWR